MSDYEFKMGIYLGELRQPWEQSLATARDLGSRASHPDATLADLYDPDPMPAGLRKAPNPRPRRGQALSP